MHSLVNVLIDPQWYAFDGMNGVAAGVDSVVVAVPSDDRDPRILVEEVVLVVVVESWTV
jgi:hypothetical protein